MTGGEITKVLYQCVKAMDLPVTGEVYYKGMRPLQNGDDPGNEDIVVAVLTGTAGQIQKGSCVEALRHDCHPRRGESEGTFRVAQDGLQTAER